MKMMIKRIKIRKILKITQKKDVIPAQAGICEHSIRLIPALSLNKVASVGSSLLA